ncbi:lipocalin family protein [Aquimarina sp. 2-A2]|uniref:lipocalin family protein n=1 Tax=Aquimarina sp. 2-A2 TaxID=3382644 RepID=UPI00387F28C4
MKKISVFILLIAATFASCSKDDDGGSEISEANLIGKWQWTASTENGEVYQLDECDLKDFFQLKSGGELSGISYGKLTTTTNGQTTFTCEEYPYSSKWSLSGDTLSVTYTDGNVSETETSTIKELTDSKLVIEYSYEDSDGNGNVKTYVDVETYKKI